MLELIAKGGPVMIPILACSVAALAIVLERIAVIAAIERKGAHLALVDGLARAAGFPGDGASRDAFDRSASIELSRFARRLEGPIRTLELLAKLSPMLGLLGTVTGLTSTFRTLADSTVAASPAALSSGIWEAMITTIAGLVVAIPCVACAHALDRKVESLRFEAVAKAETLAFGAVRRASGDIAGAAP
jgi:biopolymer transport protein ExbB